MSKYLEVTFDSLYASKAIVVKGHYRSHDVRDAAHADSQTWQLTAQQTCANHAFTEPTINAHHIVHVD
jgi:hypothetical protein